MGEESEKLIGINLVDWIRNNWLWAAPLTYFYVTVVGMVQSWLQFRVFGINVFEFSELNDFLLAAFREPLAFFAILGVIAYGALGVLVQFVVQKIVITDPSARKKLMKTTKKILPFVFVFALITAPYFGPWLVHQPIREEWKQPYGQEWKERLMAEPNRNVSALLRGLASNGKTNGWIEDLTLIGTTEKFVFFHEKSTNNVLISPVSNVIIIEKAGASIKCVPVLRPSPTDLGRKSSHE